MIYLWETPKTIKNKEIGCYNEDLSPDRFLLYYVKPIINQEIISSPQVEFSLTQNGVLVFDCLTNNSNVPLVNQRVKDILEDIASKEIQFINADIICTNGVLKGAYYYLNILNKVMAIDHEKSVYTKYTDSNGILRFEYLVYNANALNGLNIARDFEFAPHLLVNEKIKTAFDKEKITGVRFIRSEDIDWSFNPSTTKDFCSKQ